jgi:hypothetical protein
MLLKMSAIPCANLIFPNLTDSITCQNPATDYAEQMDASFKPQPLISEVLPGFATLGIIATAYFANHPGQLEVLAREKGAGEIIAGGLFTLLLSWIIGTIFDTIRDLVEHLLDRRFPVNWQFLFNGQMRRLKSCMNHGLPIIFSAETAPSVFSSASVAGCSSIRFT